MMERLLATINANQEKADANIKTMQEKMDAHQAKMNAMHKKMMDRIYANLKSTQERMNAGHKEMMAWLKDLNSNGGETMACKRRRRHVYKESQPQRT
jgi:multidrug resistance efflux pump